MCLENLQNVRYCITWQYTHILGASAQRVLKIQFNDKKLTVNYKIINLF